ncbi:CinA family protein [Phycicoccus flavus]|uniref:CinA family protein n=1 Tax=Phycicoccus flavus TaxID=2502783 RepID=UPI000FEC0BE4|nr:CinA family protein [Phycicoccus flavus]NHA67799.1 CinA family protein [Phycicoccus flavus]
MSARDVVRDLAAAGWTVAGAESLTGGLVTAALTSVPGASAVVRGGVVSYATDVKASVLGVDAGLLAERGAVDPDVARGMAEGVRRLLGATFGVATTGVAGPEPADGKPVGEVHVAVAGPAGTRAERRMFSGGREEIRRQTVDAVLLLLGEECRNLRDADPPAGYGGALSGPPTTRKEAP